MINTERVDQVRANRRIFRLACHLIQSEFNNSPRCSGTPLSVSSRPSKLRVHLHVLGLTDAYHLIPRITRQVSSRDIEITFGHEVPKPADYHILVSGMPTKEILNASPNLTHVIMPWAGILPEMCDIMKDYRHLEVHKLPFNANSTAETALALLLAAAKNVVKIDKALRSHDWSDRYDITKHGVLLSDKRALIIGFGAIGQVTGRHLLALGMEVHAIKRNPEHVQQEHNPLISLHGTDKLHDLLSHSNIVMITAPGTDETADMIGKDELNLLPEHSVIVNVGRGSIINQKALYEALKSKRLGAAGIDVWWNYPQGNPIGNTGKLTPIQTQDYPFHELDNIVMSPHRAGGSRDFRRQQMDYLGKVICDFYDGIPLSAPVDIDAGY